MAQLDSKDFQQEVQLLTEPPPPKKRRLLLKKDVRTICRRLSLIVKASLNLLHSYSAGRDLCAGAASASQQEASLNGRGSQLLPISWLFEANRPRLDLLAWPLRSGSFKEHLK